MWPEGRIWHEMVRLPKPTGGCRLITLMHTLIRWWSRARAGSSKAWLVANPSADIWGLGAGRSSSDAAFDLNIETEISEAMGEKTLTVLMDAWKFFETIRPESLLLEARIMGMPMRLVRLLLELYRQPRRLSAFGSVSYEVTAYQGVLAGCSHACALVSVLLYRLLDHIRSFGVIPRALVDDVTLYMAAPGA